MASALRATILAILAAMLGACGHGGGGGGGGSGTPTEIPPAPAPNQTPAPAQQNETPAQDQNAQRQSPPPDNAPRTDVSFTSFSAVKPSQNVRMSGEDRAIVAKQLSDGTVQPITTNTGAERDATLTLGFDSKRSLAAITIRDFPESTNNVAFDRSAGHTISCNGGGICTASSPTASAVIGDALGNGWNYQTYGVWAVQFNPTIVAFGAVSAGTATPGNAVPTTGTANFFGSTSGYFLDAAGIRHTTNAEMIANVDFQNRAIGFNTHDTTFSNSTGGGIHEGLNLFGTLTWAPGFNRFSGRVQTADRTLDGNASGKFYGPKAEEIGGTYQLGGTQEGVSRMIGGFGGVKR
jgi:transferrin binding protein